MAAAAAEVAQRLAARMDVAAGRRYHRLPLLGLLADEVVDDGSRRAAHQQHEDPDDRRDRSPCRAWP